MTAPGRTPTTTVSAISPRPLRTLLGAGVGNTLEWYDWSVYAIFAPFFAGQFFVGDSPTGALLSTLAVFAVGFLMRPIGGFVFGWLADQRGRCYSMTTSMLLMAAGSLVIAVAPTHAQIGVLAAVVLVLARLAQGLAHGGEIAASYTYVAEIAPPARRGLWSTSLYISVTAGIVLASLIGAAATSTLGAATVREWAWRIPFLVGALLGLVGLYLRRRLPETEAFTGGATTNEPSSNNSATNRADANRADANEAGASVTAASVVDAVAATRSLAALWRGLAGNKANLARILGLSLGVTVVYYVWAVGISSFAITAKGVPAAGALWGTVIANLFFMVSLPLWGKLADRFGRKPVFVSYGVAFLVLSFPLLGAVNGDPVRLTVITAVALFFLGAFVGPMPAYFAELFPAPVRASGVGVPYSFVVALFGGTAPYLLTWLASKDLEWVFASYMVVLVLVGLVTTLLTPETKDRVLT